jgi:hypothetical protein
VKSLIEMPDVEQEDVPPTLANVGWLLLEKNIKKARQASNDYCALPTLTNSSTKRKTKTQRASKQTL